MFSYNIFSSMIKQFDQITKLQLIELIQSRMFKTKNQDGTFTYDQIIQFAEKYFGFRFGRPKIKKAIKKFNFSNEKSVPKETVVQIYWAATLSKKQQQKNKNKQNRLTSQMIQEYENIFEGCQLKFREQFSLDCLKNKSYIKLLQQQELTQEMLEIIKSIYMSIDLKVFEQHFIKTFGENTQVSALTFRYYLNTQIYTGYQLTLVNQIYSHDLKQNYIKIDKKLALQIVQNIQQLKHGYYVLMAPLILFAEKYFQKFDKNKNNFIELDQLKQFYQQHADDMKGLRIRHAKQIMGKFDVNGDRKLGKGQVLLSLIQLINAKKLWKKETQSKMTQ